MLISILNIYFRNTFNEKRNIKRRKFIHKGQLKAFILLLLLNKNYITIHKNLQSNHYISLFYLLFGDSIILSIFKHRQNSLVCFFFFIFQKKLKII